MTKRSVRLTEHPPHVGIVHINGVFIPEIKFDDPQRIIITLPLFDQVKENDFYSACSN